MPGLAAKINFNDPLNSEKCLSKISKAYKVPTLSYSEKFFSTSYTFFYSLFPGFIKDDKLGQFLNKRYVVALDGDYYNFDELKNYFSQKIFSKLELIFLLYRKFGDEFAIKLNGEFNIVIFDKKRREVLITNDRFARRTFYYEYTQNKIILSSEKKGILALTGTKQQINYTGILEVFSFGHNINKTTFINNIYSVLPGSVIKASNGKLSVNSYFNWNFEHKYIKGSRIELIENFKFLIEEAVNKRIKNKKKILLWLSGGYDSRAIAAAIKKENRSNIDTKTIGEQESEELKIAEKVSSALGLNWGSLKINQSYLNIAEIGAWRSEFSISALEHPFSSLHHFMYGKYNYILSGLPGLDTLNGGHLKLGKILASLKGDFAKNMFINYAKSKKELNILFREDFLNKFFQNVKDNFYEELNKNKSMRKLDRWDNFNLMNRQPFFSHPSDLVENDFIETLHPFCDIEVSEFLRKLPLEERLFQRFSKSFFYSYPELRKIPFDSNRGTLKSNSNLIFLFYLEIKKRKTRQQKSLIWNKTKSFISQKNLIEKFLSNSFSNNEFDEIFSFQKIRKIISDTNNLDKNLTHLSKLVTFIFAYNHLISNSQINIPVSVLKHYENFNSNER